MLTFWTVLIMIGVAYAYWREGIFIGFCNCVCIVLAGVITFNFYEPLTRLLEGALRRTFLHGFEDFLVLVALFSLSLALLRAGVDNLVPTTIEYPAVLHQFGGALVGLLAGYLVCGFLLCAMQTLPWHENFMYFETRTSNESPFRSVMPPDRVWLSMLRYAGAHGLAGSRAENPASDSPYDSYSTFDREGTFELRYQRYRRYNDTRDPLPYLGEFDRELKRLE